jgi:hypothetical protein
LSMPIPFWHVVGCNVAERHSAVAYAAHRGGARI